MFVRILLFQTNQDFTVHATGVCVRCLDCLNTWTHIKNYLYILYIVCLANWIGLYLVYPKFKNAEQELVGLKCNPKWQMCVNFLFVDTYRLALPKVCVLVLTDVNRPWLDNYPMIARKSDLEILGWCMVLFLLNEELKHPGTLKNRRVDNIKYNWMFQEVSRINPWPGLFKTPTWVQSVQCTYSPFMERDILNKRYSPQQMMKVYQLIWIDLCTGVPAEQSKTNLLLVFIIVLDCTCILLWLLLWLWLCLLHYCWWWWSWSWSWWWSWWWWWWWMMMDDDVVSVVVVIVVVIHVNVDCSPLPPSRSEGVPMSTNSCCCMCGTPMGARQSCGKLEIYFRLYIYLYLHLLSICISYTVYKYIYITIHLTIKYISHPQFIVCPIIMHNILEMNIMCIYTWINSFPHWYINKT